MILGVIADDHTGATDVASMLVRSGLRTVQIIGVPSASTDAGDVDAVVIALKSLHTATRGDRTIAGGFALAAAAWCAAFLFQILFDLRFHVPGQYRTGGRCSDAGAGHTLFDRLSCVS